MKKKAKACKHDWTTCPQMRCESCPFRWDEKCGDVVGVWFGALFCKSCGKLKRELKCKKN